MQYPSAKYLFRIRLLLLSGSLLIVAIVLFDSLSTDSNRIGSMGRNGSGDSKTKQEMLLESDELLHARLWQLQNMDQQFTSQLNEVNNEGGLVSTNMAIQNAELGFKKSIDSIERVGKQYDEKSGTNDFQNMTLFFKTILQNRRLLAYARLDLVSEDKGEGNYKQTILQLQDELNKKDKIIAASVNSTDDSKEPIRVENGVAEKDVQIRNLETQIQKEQTEKQGYTVTIQKLQNEAIEKDKLITSLGNNSTKGPADTKLLAGLQNELTEKNKQIRDFQTQIQKEQLEKKTYSQEIQKFRSELVEKDKMIGALSNIKIPENVKGPGDPKAMVDLQNGITAKNKQIRDLEAQVQKEQLEKKTYSQEVQKFRSELVEKDKMIGALSNIKVPTRATPPSDQKAVVNLQNGITEKNQQIRELEAQIQKDQAEKKTYSQSIQKFQSELVEKDKMIAAMGNKKGAGDQKAVANLQNGINQKNTQIRELQNQLQKEQSEKNTYSQTIQKLQSDLIEKNKLIVSWGNKKPADQKGLQSLQNEIADKNKRIRSLEVQLQSRPTVGNNSNKSATGESLQDLQQRNTNLRLAYNNTLTQLGVLTKQYNLMRAELNHVKNQK